ncbi:LPS assembly protein LptD [bacterium]|nr:LPS assembly protein LptD [bacterium]
MPGRLRPMTAGRGLWLVATLLVAASALSALLVRAEPSPKIAGDAGPIQIFADWSQEWADDKGHVAMFRGHCRIVQGDFGYSADKAVVWVRREATPQGPIDRLAVYLEDEVFARTADGDASGSQLVAHLKTAQGITLTVRGRQTDTPGYQDELYQRALSRRDGQLRTELIQTQLTIDPQTWQAQMVQLPGSAAPVRRVRIFQRGALPFSVQSEVTPNSTPPEQVVYITGGVQLLFDGLDASVGTIDLSADRAIIWTTALGGTGMQFELTQTTDQPYEVYLEGNIVIRQGENVIRADRAYYDAREDRALVLNAELKAFLPDEDVSVRIRADRLRQTSAMSYHAQNAWISTSQLGRPGYRLQASDVFIDYRPSGSLFGGPVPVQIDQTTGREIPQLTPWATITNSTLVVGETPVFYSPYVSVPADDPGIPLQALTFRQDRIFGTQIRTQWDAFQLLGLEQPPDSKWTAEFDYLSDRGPLLGTNGRYRGIDGHGNPFMVGGLATYVHDDGDDNLGFDRRSLVPADQNRGILQLQHRHLLQDNWMLQTEIGYASDRNFREQYYEQDFDQQKDVETLGWLKKQEDHWAASLLVRPQTNEFENTTQWLPRGDFTTLGQPILGDWLNWSSHSYAAYATLEPAEAPTDPNDLYSPLPYVTSADGVVAMTRHEITAPFNLGPVKLSPYALGEAAFWGDSFTNNSIDRYYVRAGLRGSMTAWKVYPYLNSDIFNLTGLAHKMVFDFDYGWADSSRDLSEIPQWNEFDDDAQERFRERLLVNTFGGVLPPEFDPRFYAVRSLTGTSVTAQYHELVDDQQALRLGWRHRLQTKVGPPDRQRIKDWMTLDLGITYFPDSTRDNFGEELGLFSTRYAWHVGDRTSILASSLVDFFDNAQNLYSVGVLSQRSVRGSVYMGYRQIQGGPLNSQILTASYSYQMSPKWISTASTAYDVGEGQNRGQSLTVSQVGEWYVIHYGFNYDASKDNLGVSLAIEPRLGKKGGQLPQLSSLLQSY